MDRVNFDIFRGIPKVIAENATEVRRTECGAGNYVMELKNLALEEYRSYLELLSKNGFTKHVDNGSKGLEESVWNAVYCKDGLVVTVIYMAKRNRCYISAGRNVPISPHLFYQEQYLEGNSKEVKTSLHMLELYHFGDCFVIQLKNGHFIMDDSGLLADAPYILDYLEKLTPPGEKPIVEAWFISHGHLDHTGTFAYFVEHPEYAERISIEGIYFSEPSDEITKATHVYEDVQLGVRGFANCKTCLGTTTPIYRPQTGQRYYFNDLTIDVLHTQEQVLFEDYSNGFNESSTWLLYTMEGQKFLHAGDAGMGSVNVVKSTYNQEYLSFDVMATFHHGQNVEDSYVDYFGYKTVLYTTFVIGSQTKKWKPEENRRLQARASECMSWGDGTKVLTFPYEVGAAQSLPLRDWVYSPDRKPPVPF